MTEFLLTNQYNIKQKSDENKENIKKGDYQLVQYQIKKFFLPSQLHTALTYDHFHIKTY